MRDDVTKFIRDNNEQTKRTAKQVVDALMASPTKRLSTTAFLAIVAKLPSNQRAEVSMALERSQLFTITDYVVFHSVAVQTYLEANQIATV